MLNLWLHPREPRDHVSVPDAADLARLRPPVTSSQLRAHGAHLPYRTRPVLLDERALTLSWSGYGLKVKTVTLILPNLMCVYV